MKTNSLRTYILSIGIWMLMIFANQVSAQTAFKLGIGGAMSSRTHSIIDYKLQPSFSVDARTVLRLGKR